jgi:hypothetical protein
VRRRERFGWRFIVSDRVRGHPNKFAMTSDDCLFCFACGAPGAIDPGLGGCPQSRLGSARNGARRILCELLKPIPSRGCWSTATWWDMISVVVKGPTAMQRSAHALVLGLLLCLLLLASSIAWARHYRVTAEPCPDRCKSTRLSLCSACMGGVMTCAQQHVCSNNRAVVCGEESTVSRTCWGPRIRW